MAQGRGSQRTRCKWPACRTRIWRWRPVWGVGAATDGCCYDAERTAAGSLTWPDGEGGVSEQGVSRTVSIYPHHTPFHFSCRKFPYLRWPLSLSSVLPRGGEHSSGRKCEECDWEGDELLPLCSRTRRPSLLDFSHPIEANSWPLRNTDRFDAVVSLPIDIPACEIS